ncbi:MAG: isoprenoid biosynthesis glyoxalase ElbB [Acidobacteria bacterium]|nr:isoprenoid biosynthesis glyoxalase ElbB [Acidobacteriota bacterium]
MLCGLALFLTAVAPAFAQTSNQVRVGVVFSGSGMMDGTELSEGVLTMLFLERGKAIVTYMAPDIPQADVINHAGNKPDEGKRNVLAESARLSRGNIRDIASVKAADLDALILTGGLGSVKNLSDFLSKGTDCTVNPDVARLIRDMYAAKKPIGSMCLATANVAKVLGRHKITVTIGGATGFVAQLQAMGAIHVIGGAGDIVIDKNNRIVTTPAMMVGPSTADIAVGIEKMIKQVLLMAGK